MKKQGLSLTLAIKVEDDIVLTGSLGNAEELSECISILAEDFEDRVGVHYKDFKKKLGECNCQGCNARRGETEQDKVSDDVLAKFLEALFEVSKEE